MRTESAAITKRGMMAIQRSDARKAAPSGRTTTLEPIGFWSYARLDDENAENGLSNLRLALRRELTQQLGENVQLFQDVAAIPWGSDWESEIQRAINRSTFFIPIVTPRFIKSEECAKEIWLFVERQRALRELHPDLPYESLIFPILYVDIDGVDPIDRDAFDEIMKRQIHDFDLLRIKDIDSEPVRMWIATVARDLCRVLRARIAIPPSPEEREAAERAAQAASIALAEAKAQAEREAEEARQRRAEAAEIAAKQAAHRAAVAAEVAAHDAKVAALAALGTRLEKGLEFTRAQHKRRTARTSSTATVRRKLVLAIAWIVGGCAVLFGLLVIYAIVTTPRTIGGQTDDAQPPLAGNASTTAALPAPTKPRFAAESWITASSWAVYGHCEEAITFSIRGDDLIVASADATERYPINAARSTAEQLVAQGQTLVRSGSDRMTVQYPDSKVELVPCASRR